MRSHSRLDLYAKSVAVFGLGCLGAIGAVVDYWPTRALLPDVPNVAWLERQPSVLTVVDIPGYASPGDAFAIETISFTTERVVLRPVQQPAAPRVVRARLVTSRPMARATFVGPAQPVPDVLPALVEDGLPSLPADTLASLAGVPDEVEETASLALTVLAAHQDDEGFLSGVWRKTGSSVGTVGTTISKAGGSVVGAFRSVGDLVKRAF